MKWLSLLFLAGAGCLAGCGSGVSVAHPVTMSDSFDLDIFGAHTNTLHFPYLAGSQFSISVSSNTNADMTGWTIVSSDPDVIRVGPLYNGSSNVTTGGDGQATISVVDESGRVQDSQDVTVELPDQVSIYAQGLLLTGAGDTASEVTSVSVLSGGEAIFLVRYFKEGTELFGSGALTTTATGDVTASTVLGGDGNLLAAARDFVEVTPPSGAGGSGSLSLVLANVVVSTLPVTTVTSVSHVDLVAQSTETAKTGDPLVVYAHAVDATGQNVFGASYGWTVNGASVGDPQYDVSSGPSDLFEYNYNPSVTETVGADLDSFSPTTTVHGQGGTVDSTVEQSLACAVCAPGGTNDKSKLPLLGLALGIGLFGVVRRRRVA
jgi:hypothetical protein